MDESEVCDALEVSRPRLSSLAVVPIAGLRPSRDGGGGACMGRLLAALPGCGAAEAGVEAVWLIHGERFVALCAGEGIVDAEGKGVSLEGMDGGSLREGEGLVELVEAVKSLRWFASAA